MIAKASKYVNPNDLGKIPPQDIELERAVLGAILLESNTINDVLEVIRSSEVFYYEPHQEIFSAIIAMVEEGKPIDLLTVTSELRRNNKLEGVGGSLYLTEIMNKMSSTANTEVHCRILLEKAIKRKIISASSAMINESYAEENDALDILERANEILTEINGNTERKRAQSLKEVLKKSFDLLYEINNSKNNIIGVPSGFIDLDKVTHGWQRSDLIIIAARPSMGKSAMAIRLAANSAIRFKRPVAIFTLEMSAVQLIQRIQAGESNIELEKIRSGKLSSADFMSLNIYTGQIEDAPIYIDETPGLTILELRAKLKNLTKKHNVEVAIIDYLQLMQGSGKNRTEEIGRISRNLKGLAKEFDIPIIALSQLSRAVETRGGDKRPILSDLRESGDIEQDADIVMFLYRPEYYGIKQDEAGNSTQGICEILISKHRNGRLADIPLKFNGSKQMFYDYLPNGFTQEPTGKPYEGFNYPLDSSENKENIF